MTRLSGKTIFIQRNDPLGFIKDPTSSLPHLKPSGDSCWQLLAGDTAVKLHTSTCPNGKLGLADSDYGVSVTLDKDIPDQIILIAPNSATFPLDVPKLKAADTSKTPPITLKQFDSNWIDIPNVACSKVTSVEAYYCP